MNIVRSNPWQILDQFSRELDGFLNTRAARPAHWTPAVDVKEESDRFVLTADIPGVDPKDIEITADGDVLTIKAERKQENRDGDDNNKNGYQRVERFYGTFLRRFTLPETAAVEQIDAKGVNGVLTLVIPKKEKTQPRKIAVAA